MSWATIAAADIENIEAEFGTAASMTWSGTAYAGTLTVIQKRDELEPGGLVPGYDAQFILRTELFTSARPNVGQQVVIASKTYRIIEVGTDPDDVVMTLDLSGLRV